MARLINDSGVLGDAVEVTAENVKDVGFSTMIDAIHVVQEQQKIAGTTGREAAQTIEGSFNSLKSTYSNWTASLAKGDGSIVGATDDVAEAFGNVADNVIPAVTRTFGSFLDAIPEFKAKMLPALKSAFSDLVDGVQDELKARGIELPLPDLGPLRERAAQVSQAVSGAFNAIKTGPVGDAFSKVGEAVGGVVSRLRELGIGDKAKDALGGLGDVARGALSDGMERAGDAANLVRGVLEDLGESGIVQDLKDVFQDVAGTVGKLLAPALDLIKTKSKAVMSAVSAFASHASGIGSGLGGVLSTIGDIVSTLGGAASEFMQGPLASLLESGAEKLTQLADTAGRAIENLLGGFNQVAQSDEFKSAIQGVADSVASFGEKLEAFNEGVLTPLWENVLKPITDFIADNIAPLVGSTLATAVQLAATAFSGLLDALGWIVDKLTVVGGAVGDFCSGVAAKFDEWGIADKVSSIWSGIQSFIEDPVGTLKETVGGFVDGVAAKFDEWGLADKANTIWSGVKGFIDDPVGTTSETISGWIGNVKTAFDTWGISDVANTVWSGVKGFIDDPIGTTTTTIGGWITGVKAAFDNWGIDGVADSVWTNVKSFIDDPVGSLSNTVAGFVDGVAAKFDEWGLADKASDIFGGVSENAGSLIEGAESRIGDAIEAIKGIFDFDLEFPHINLPHFKISGGEAPWGIAGAGTPPSFDIEWYARGGIVDGAQLIGAGEAGPELIWPSYEPYLSRYASAIAAKMGGGARGSVTQNFEIRADDPGLVAAMVARRQRRASAAWA